MGALRDRVGDAVFARVAGPDGIEHRERIHGTPGPRWFPRDSAISRVHGDASMFVGGMRAVILQTLHPAAMRGVSEHSGYRGDMWGRLARTSRFLAVTTFGAAPDAQAAVDLVRRIHDTVTGTMPDGTTYSASDPHLLAWVHAAEIDSFLLAHQVYGLEPLDQAGRDAYVAETALVAEKTGRRRPAAHRGRPARRAGVLPARAAGDARGTRGGVRRAVAAAPAARRPPGVRHAADGRHRTDAHVEPRAVGAAVPAAAGPHAVPRPGPRLHRDDPVGDDVGELQLAGARRPPRPSPRSPTPPDPADPCVVAGRAVCCGGPSRVLWRTTARRRRPRRGTRRSRPAPSRRWPGSRAPVRRPAPSPPRQPCRHRRPRTTRPGSG